MEIARKANGHFAVGNRGGPGRGPTLRTEIEARFGPAGANAWECLARIMGGQEESIEERVLSSGEIVEIRRRPTISEKAAAAELVIAYLEGKPHQTAVVATVNSPEMLPDVDLRLRVAEILARFAAGPALAPAAERTIDAERVDVLPAKS